MLKSQKWILAFAVIITGEYIFPRNIKTWATNLKTGFIDMVLLLLVLIRDNTWGGN